MNALSWRNRWAGWQDQLAMWSSWEDDLNVSGAHPRAAWWSWLLLAAGALAVMVAMDQLDALRAQQEDAAQQVKRLSRADRQMRLQRALSLAPASRHHGMAGTNPTDMAGNEKNPAPALQGPALPAAQRMVGLLAYPWRTHLDLVDAQATQAQAVMMRVSASLDAAMTPGAAVGRSGTPAGMRWQLLAFAKDDAAALALAQRLPRGELISRDVAPQPFTTRAGTYTLNVSLEMQP